jgi:hypothetical protein
MRRDTWLEPSTLLGADPHQHLGHRRLQHGPVPRRHGEHPESYYEAATIDGATQWRQFWTITLPLIWDILAISIVFLIIGGMKAFEIIWLLTNQRPQTDNHVIATRMVQTMFNEFNVGEATALAVLLFLMVFVGSAATLRGMRRENGGDVKTATRSSSLFCCSALLRAGPVPDALAVLRLAQGRPRDLPLSPSACPPCGTGRIFPTLDHRPLRRVLHQ